MTDKMQRVKQTIKSWVKSNNYPPEFLNFFFHWTLFNLFYNELSKEEEEVFRVLDFGRKHEKLFPRIKENMIALIRTECVGEGREDSPPNEWVKTASLKLRRVLHVNPRSICTKCRNKKRQECQQVKIRPYKFGEMEAAMRILYQIRCNLFHGDKTEHTNGEQAKRNWFLVEASDKIIERILHSII